LPLLKFQPSNFLYKLGRLECNSLFVGLGGWGARGSEWKICQ